MTSTSINVLHVDDESALTELSALYLQRENERIAVQTATNASEGLDAVVQNDIDCIISDFNMPGQNGLEFLEAVRKAGFDLPFILYTGKGSEEVASDAIAAGVTDYLQKRAGSEQYELLANRITNAVEQHRSTQRAADLERIRQVIRKANRALVRAETRDEVEQHICQIITDADPYRFAWICELDPNSQNISANTVAGVEDGYLDAIEITTDGEPTGQGPTGNAVRHREISVVQNIPENAAFEPWREYALERGYQSSAAIPISRDDTLYGILNVYADRTDAFDDEEQKLLQELADDTAHALHRLESRERDKELRETKERLNLALAETKTGIWEWNVETGEVIWDTTLEESVGLDPGAFEGTVEAFEQRVHPEDWPDVEEALAQARENDELYEIQFRMCNEDGGVIWVGVRGHLVGGDAAAERMIGVHHDVTEQQVRKRELQRENTKFRSVFEESFDAMVIVDDDGRFVKANESVTDLFGVAKDELLGRSIAEFVPDAFDAEEPWHEAQTPDADRGIFSLVRPDGKRYVEYAVTRNIVPDQHLAVLRDVTERKEHERRYNAIFNQTYQFTGLLDPDGTLIEVNETVLEFGGIDREDVIGKKMWEGEWFQHSTDTVERARSAVRRAAKGEFVRLELPIQGSDGEVIIDFSVRPILNDDGEVTFLIPEGRDITERKEREEERRRRAEELEELTTRLNEQYRTLFEEAPVMTVITRADEGTPIIKDCNDRFLETLGYDKEAIVNRNLTELYTPDSTEQLLESGGYRRSLEDEFTREHRDLLTADGEIVDTLLRAVPHRDMSGEVVGTLAMYIDITEQENLKRVNERLEEFARTLTHDLRNPLAVATGRLRLARQECDSEHLDVVGRAHERMDALVSDILTLAREGAQVEAVETVTLEDVATDCWEQVASGRATMIVESERSLQADRSRLQQLLENLMRNAVEHGGKAVTVTVGDQADGFYVEDDGPGISSADRDDVFEIDYSTATTGTGFGLSIVRQIVDAHDWEIDITEGSEGGARFEITGVECAGE